MKNLTTDEKNLLEISAKELTALLEKSPELIQVKQVAFDYKTADEDEFF